MSSIFDPLLRKLRTSDAGAGDGDTIAPASNTADYVPQWNGADSKMLKDGLAVGTVANNLVQLDGDAKLPAVDGSQLTNLPAGSGFTTSDNTAAPNDTVNAAALVAASASTNADIVLNPKGTGAVLAQIPDGTAAGGNKRGANAVDLQTDRNNADQVASGTRSVVIGGLQNRATQNQAGCFSGFKNSATGDSAACLGGRSCTASGINSCVAGNGNNASGGESMAVNSNNLAPGANSFACGFLGSAYLTSQKTFASDWFAVRGDAQASLLTALTATADAASKELSLNRTATTRAIIPTNKSWGFKVTLTASDTTSGTEGDSKMWTFEGLIKNVATAVSFVGTPAKTVIAADTNAASWDADVVADDTNKALVIQATGESAKNIRWVARIELTEIGF